MTIFHTVRHTEARAVTERPEWNGLSFGASKWTADVVSNELFIVGFVLTTTHCRLKSYKSTPLIHKQKTLSHAPGIG